MSTLNDISIVTEGYFCDSTIGSIAVASHGYVCEPATPPPGTLDPMCIATHGYVSDSELEDIAIYSHGYVCGVEVIIIPVKRGGSSAGTPITYNLKSKKDIQSLKEKIMREDEEIVEVIVALVREIHGHH